MQNTKLIKWIKFATVCATVFLFAMIGLITFQYVKINNVNKQIDDLDNKITLLQKKQDELEGGVSNRSTSIYVEEYARNKLGMLDEDESYFYFEED